MAKINSDQLQRQLNSGLSPVYLVSGDEELLVIEACDAIRQAARKQGFNERELFHFEAGFQWGDLLESANSMSLFAERKLLELRLSNFKLGDAGSKALQEYCDRPSEDNILLIICSKMDKRTQNSAWAKAIIQAGCHVTVWPVNEAQLPRWLDQRIKRAGLSADSQAIDILAGKIEGNLLAAAQEIEKLKLLSHDGMIDAKLMASAVADSARFSVFGLVDKALAGDARAAGHTLNGLKGEGTEATLILWALARELRTLMGIKQAQSSGLHPDQAAKTFGVFSSRLGLVKQALQRLSLKQLQTGLDLCAVADRSIKGMSRFDAWNILLEITLLTAGTPSLSPRSVALLQA